MAKPSSSIASSSIRSRGHERLGKRLDGLESAIAPPTVRPRIIFDMNSADAETKFAELRKTGFDKSRTSIRTMCQRQTARSCPRPPKWHANLADEYLTINRSGHVLAWPCWAISETSHPTRPQFPLRIFFGSNFVEPGCGAKRIRENHARGMG